MDSKLKAEKLIQDYERINVLFSDDIKTYDFKLERINAIESAKLCCDKVIDGLELLNEKWCLQSIDDWKSVKEELNKL